MSTLVLKPSGRGPLFGTRAVETRSEAMSAPDDDSCGGERIIDFALCLIVAAAVVGLLLLAL